jgi:hypothetical protein
MLAAQTFWDAILASFCAFFVRLAQCLGFELKNYDFRNSFRRGEIDQHFVREKPPESQNVY